MSVTISNSVTSIGYRAFYDCSNLAKIIFKNRQLSQIPSGSPWDAPNTTVIETWNDVSQEWVKEQHYILSSDYESKGQGTFGINPTDGLSGFYIGKDNFI